MGFREVQALIDHHPGLAEFVGGVSDEEIREFERQLGVKLPVSYMEFLRAYGVGNFGGEEFFGLGIPHTAVPSALWYTEVNRKREPAFPQPYVAVYDAGLGEILCLATDRLNANGECPVVAWVPGAPKQHMEVVADTFADLVLDLVNGELDDLK